MSIKNNNEITVKINTTKQQFINLLISKGFKQKTTQYLEDFYFVPKTVDLKINSVREILSKAVLIRNLYSEDKKLVKGMRLCYKQKVFNNNDEIVEQKSYNVEILNPEDAKKFLNAIGYDLILNINEYEYQFVNNNLMFEIKQIVNGDLIMEIETISNSEFSSLDEVIKYLKQLSLPIDYSNLFVKKAEIELSKIINK